MPQIIEIPGHGNVEFPDGMSNEDILGAVQKLSPPQAGPPSGGLPPDIQARYESGQHPLGLPKIPVAPASMAAPGTGFLGNMAGQGIASGAEALAQGKGPLQAGQEALGGALGGGAGALASKALGYVASPLTHRLFSGETAGKIAEWAQKNIPAWKGYSADAKGLHAMAHEDGQRKLSAMFEAALEKEKAKIPEDAQVVLHPRLAQKAGIQGPMRSPMMARGNDEPTVSVSARELLDRMPKITDQGVKRGVINGLIQVLPEGVMTEAREQYKKGSGMIEFLRKSGALAGERYDASKAMGALSKPAAQSLYGRTLDDLAQIVRGPGEQVIEKSKPNSLGWHLGMGAGGALGGLGLGHGGPAAGLGALLGTLIPPPTMYRNVPTGPVQNFLQSLAPRAGGMVGDKMAE